MLQDRGGEALALEAPDYDHFQIAIWERRRPEYRYGVAWLPEFWLTLVLGVGLVVSIWKDQRHFRKPEAKAA